MALTFHPVVDDHAADAIEFLVSNEWPFHGTPRLTTADAASVAVTGDDVAAFWVRDGDRTVGIVRGFDLDDVVDGSPLIDLRIAESERGRGVGTAALTWLTDHLFDTYPELHRIEATTRGDNHAMQRVFERCGYRAEGRMVEAWRQADGTRFDALAYAILRRGRRHSPPDGAPQLFATEPIWARPGRPTGRVIVPADHDPAGPAFFEWELRAEEWSDEHLHDEWVYVLDGELHVEADGVAVVGTTGALIRVPSGSRGTYRAPVHARILSVYGPRAPHPADAHGVLRDLDSDEAEGRVP